MMNVNKAIWKKRGKTVKGVWVYSWVATAVEALSSEHRWDGKVWWRPTFALLLDRTEDCLHCGGTSGRMLVPGHLRELAEWMTLHGDPRGVEVGALLNRRWFVRWDKFQPDYADACRELIRRVKGMLTEAAWAGG
jgi:hypothetical protein